MDNVSALSNHTLRMAQAKQTRRGKTSQRNVTAALKEMRERAGLTMTDMAGQLGYKGASSYQRYEDPGLYKRDYLPPDLIRRLLLVLPGKGSPQIATEEVAALGDWRDDTPRIRGSCQRQGAMPVLGEVQAGTWREVEESQDQDSECWIPVCPSASTTDRMEYALTVRGESMNRVAHDGDYVVCLNIAVAGAAPGDLVVVERTRDDGSIREVTVKRLTEEFDGGQILMPESTDPRYQQSLPCDDNSNSDVTVTIKAIVLMVLSPQHRSIREQTGIRE